MKPIIPFLLVVIFLGGCTHDDDLLSPDPLFPAQDIFKAPLFIEVFTAEGLRVSNAKVILGSKEGYTDANGFLYWPEATVSASAYLTVEKEGYFHASRRFYPSPGAAGYIRIILLSDSRIAFFNAADGAVLPIENKATIRFPQQGYVLENGEAYNGVVVVSAKVIAADDPDLSFKMPGDLVGINAEDSFGALGSMGMMAVEMKTPDGDKLEFAEGVEATLEMHIPPSMTDNAPSTIPLWYFDELDGVWREEGIATRSGDQYVGQVKHFSYWNYDAWFPAIKWGASFDFGSNRGAASQIEVCITIISMNTTKCALTNEEGIVCGLVAANELLLMEVKSECGELIYSEEIGPFSEATMLGPFSIYDPGVLVTKVIGQVVSCDGDPVRDGFAIISVGDYKQYTSLDQATGAFDVSITTCDEGNIAILAVDVRKNKLSIQKTFEYAPWIDADTITVCEDNKELIDIEIVGFPNHYYFFFPNHVEDGGNIIYSGFPDSSQQGQGIYIELHFKGDHSGVYESRSSRINVNLPGAGWFFTNGDMIITVTEFGKIGEYIKGTFTGTCLKEDPGSPGREYPLVGTFSVVREE
ncbi:MAG TPA: hypothetical protein VLA46_02745 [Saprospiraceae bacterium]|nr:hypothetical protein [Saprospiraceae bacterium]